MYTRSAIVKDRSNNQKVAVFLIPSHAKAYCEQLNKTAGKKRYHWFESNEAL